MTRVRTTAAILALLALAGCTGSATDPDPSPAPATSAAAATGVAVDQNRAVCQQMVYGKDDPTALMSYALRGEQAPDPGVAAAAKKLTDAASGGDQLAINAVRRDIGAVCSALLGDGPW
ncbi:hypothetical protein [Micromonospora arida]